MISRAEYKRLYMIEWRAANKDKAAAKMRRYRLRHPEKIRAINARTRAKRKESGKHDIAILKRLYGVSESQALWLIEQKKKGCQNCGRLSKRMHVDHDHKTGVVRGVLCHGCNASLGFAGDNSAILRNLATYIDTKGVIHWSTEETQ